MNRVRRKTEFGTELPRKKADTSPLKIIRKRRWQFRARTCFPQPALSLERPKSILLCQLTPILAAHLRRRSKVGGSGW
jgi:hypothetical protein